MAENDKNTRFDEIRCVFVDYTGSAETLKRRSSAVEAKKGCFFETTFLIISTDLRVLAFNFDFTISTNIQKNMSLEQFLRSFQICSQICRN